MNRLRLTVTMQDGTVHEDLLINNRAMTDYEIQAANNRWPKREDGGVFLWLTSLAFWQLIHSGLYTPLDHGAKGWKQFREIDCVDIDKGEEEEPADPTRPAAELDLPSPSPSGLAGQSTDSIEQQT